MEAEAEREREKGWEHREVREQIGVGVPVSVSVRERDCSQCSRDFAAQVTPLFRGGEHCTSLEIESALFETTPLFPSSEIKISPFRRQ